MAYPMKIRALQKGDVTAITVAITHPSETGMRVDAAGRLVPAQYIQILSVRLEGKRVVDSYLNRAVAANPVFNFKVKGAKLGDKVEVNWVDSQGQQGGGEAGVMAA